MNFKLFNTPYKILLIQFFLTLSFFSCHTDSSIIPLKEYIDKTKNDFSYQIIDSFKTDNWKSYHVKMISGKWLNKKFVDDNIWWHYVDIIIPDEVNTDNGLLFIDGGTKDEDFFRLDSISTKFAVDSKSIIANISNIPFQPINFLESNQDKFLEDDLIAYAWNKFLTLGAKKEDIEWLPRFPMTRAVVRAMDLVQEISLKNKTKLNKFVISGASKRGWTSWTTAAVDDRVISVVPIVIDMLNLLPSFENHYKSYGEFSYAVQEYVDYDIHNWMSKDEFKVLMKYVEPYSFKKKYTMPKYIVNAGSDQFFSTDSWKYYYNELPNKKLLRYVPNSNHSLKGRYLDKNLMGYYQRIINNKELPKLNWKINNDSIEVSLKSNEKYEINIWTANNKKGRDFRLWEKGKLWKKTNFKYNLNGNYKIKFSDSTAGYTAKMFEFIFDSKSEYPIIITTGPYVYPDEYPFEKYSPK